LIIVLMHNLSTHRFELKALPEVASTSPRTVQGFDIALWLTAVLSVRAVAVQRRWWLAWFLGGWLNGSFLGNSSGGYFQALLFKQSPLPVRGSSD
jgi:hypothetical protein